MRLPRLHRIALNITLPTRGARIQGCRWRAATDAVGGAVYYSSKRLHSTLGYSTPMDYEKDLGKLSGFC